MLNTMTSGTVRLRLSEILKERGMKQNELAQITKLSEESISRLTGNARQVRLDTLARICDALMIVPADLIEYTPHPDGER